MRTKWVVGFSSFFVGAVAAFFVSQSVSSKSIAKQLRNLIPEKNVEVVGIGNSIVIRGYAESPSTLTDIKLMIQAIRIAHPGIGIESLVKIDPKTWDALSERIEREIGSKEITVKIVGGTVLMEGVADSEREADRAVEIAKSHLRVVSADVPVSQAGQVSKRTLSSMPSYDQVEIKDMLRVKPPVKKAN